MELDNVDNTEDTERVKNMTSRKDKLDSLPKNDDGSVVVAADLLADLVKLAESKSNASYNKKSNASKGILVKRHKKEFDALMAYFDANGVNDTTKKEVPAFSKR